MTLDEIERRVAHIKDLCGDDEAAHSAEDALHIDVLEAIANGDISGLLHIRDAARTALLTRDIDFQRWCA